MIFNSYSICSGALHMTLLLNKSIYCNTTAHHIMRRKCKDIKGIMEK